jgi:DNA-binding response OmpR family regulator
MFWLTHSSNKCLLKASFLTLNRSAAIPAKTPKRKGNPLLDDCRTDSGHLAPLLPAAHATFFDMNILVVEDDPSIRDVLEYALKIDGYTVQTTPRGREAVEIARQSSPELILLDVGLPDIDGFEVCRQIRTFSTVPVIFLTSRGDEINRVVGLEIGGDDYVVKPFSTRELMARMKAVRRRYATNQNTPPSNLLTYGPIEIDAEKVQVTCQGREVTLTRQEFKLLELLAGHPGRVFTREQVLDRAWGDGGLVTDRTIDAHIKTLRRKFGDFDFIETVRGVGYRAREL